MPSEKRKAKKQNYYKDVKQSKKYAQGKVLQEDMKGFLLTCNFQEKETVREAYNLLNEFGDELFGKDSKVDDENECTDIDAAFEKEKSILDHETSTSGKWCKKLHFHQNNH